MTRYHFDNCLLNPKNELNIIGKFSQYPKIDNRSKIFICPHCRREGKNMGNMHRWHFDNCKFKS